MKKLMSGFGFKSRTIRFNAFVAFAAALLSWAESIWGFKIPDNVLLTGVAVINGLLRIDTTGPIGTRGSNVPNEPT